MKKRILILLCIVSFTTSFAQLKVNSLGSVGIRNLTPAPNYALTIDQPSGYSGGSIRINGHGKIMRLGQYSGNAHIGSTSDQVIFYDWSTGYNHNYAQSYYSTSDLKLKSNIKTIDNGLWKISNLRGVEFNYKEDLENGIQRKVYGFISQEVAEILPDVTSEQMDVLCMDYQQIIPLLVSSVQEQQKQISALEKQIEELSRSAEENSESLFESNLSEARLYQNSPNPFKENTTIKYDLPETYQNASIMLFDLSGKLLNEYRLNREEKSLQIDGNQYHAGIYIYSLVVDQQEIDSKRLILTK